MNNSSNNLPSNIENINDLNKTLINPLDNSISVIPQQPGNNLIQNNNTQNNIQTVNHNMNQQTNNQINNNQTNNNQINNNQATNQLVNNNQSNIPNNNFQSNKQENQNQIYTNSTNQYNLNNNENSELIRAFIGPNYDKITTKQFNFAALFFNHFYIFYRKMFLYGFLSIINSLIISTIIKINIINWIIFIAIGFLFNKFYLWYVEEKITKIKAKNPDKTIDELKEICQKKGGTSIPQAIVGLITYTITAIIYVIILGLMGITTNLLIEFKDLFSAIKNSETTAENNEYNGVTFTDTTIDIKSEFSIELPEMFIDNSESYSYNYLYSSDTGVFKNCEVNLYSLEKYNDAEKLINSMEKYYRENDKTTVPIKSTINNIDWYWFSTDNAFGKEYYYSTYKNNKVFILEYKINTNAPSDCSNYRQQIINSIK